MLLRKPIYLWNLNAARINFPIYYIKNTLDYWSLTQNVKSLCVARVPINYTLHWIIFPENTQLCVVYTYFHFGKEKCCTIANWKINRSILNEYELLLCDNMVDFLLTTSNTILLKNQLSWKMGKNYSFLQTKISKS